VRVEGQLVFNRIAPMLDAALAGFGLAYLPEDNVRAHLADGRLIRVLADWCLRWSALPGLPPLLPEPPPSHAGLPPAGQCAALTWLKESINAVSANSMLGFDLPV
jgi:DNA-binding transcriptional LysR family regulator